MSYDLIIIGTGAGGGTLARALAGTGKKILIFERGGYLPREKENWQPNAVFNKGRYKAHETWFDKDEKPFHPGIHYFVGGNTKVYGAALFRLREKDFQEIKHYDGISPAWPISYQDLAPYYMLAEKMYYVHGLRNSDPTEPPESQPYPYPPVKNEPRIQELFDDFVKIGCKPFYLPLGLMLNEENREKSRCIKCDTCDGFPCLVDAKADSQIVGVDPALLHGNVELKTNTFVERLETSSSGREITAVHVVENGIPMIYRANLIVVSCGAINSSTLLLRSANSQHPNGLANSSGMVGRNYMCHNNTAAIALSTTPNHTKFEKTIGINDFYFGSDDFEYPLGHIQMLGKSHADMFKEDAPFAPQFLLRAMASHALDFWLTTEDLPNPGNRVEIRSDGGIQLFYKENNLVPHQKLTKKLKTLMSKMGRFIFLHKKIPLAGTAHQCGTLRFGHDPTRSVLDINCKAHDLDNLYVVDGSFFVSSSSVNPALTIAANALRVAEHLKSRF